MTERLNSLHRGRTIALMDQLESVLLKKGWPVPFSPYYLVHHERMLILLDQLRLSLQDDLDARFMHAFAHMEINQECPTGTNRKGEMSY